MGILWNTRAYLDIYHEELEEILRKSINNRFVLSKLVYNSKLVVI